jgi:hypothetical protein
LRFPAHGICTDSIPKTIPLEFFMKRIFTFGLVGIFGTALHAQTINVRGKISDGSGQPVANAIVELLQQGVKDTTGSDGAYSLTKTGVPIRPGSTILAESMRLDKGTLELTVGKTSPVKIEVFDVNGYVQDRDALPQAQPGVYHWRIANASHAHKMLVIQASIGPNVRTFRYLPSGKGASEGISAVARAGSAGGILAKAAAAVDTLKVSAAGKATKKIGIDSYDATVDVTLDTMPTGGVPKVTPSAATTVPSNFGTPVANPGKFTTNVTYQAYWYWKNAPSSEAFKSTPTYQKQTVPETKFYNVYLPPNYDAAKEYPLIIIMHGITDNPNMWIDRTNPKINVMFDNLITSNATKPFVAVFASGTVDDNQGAYYGFGAELMNELLPLIESKYSVKKDRGSRAMAGFSFGGMQTLTIGLCAHLKDFAWFGGLHPAGPPTPNATDIAKYVAAQDPVKYPLYYLYIGRGTNDKGAGASSADGLTTKGPYITAANFSSQDNITGGGRSHNYQSAQVALYNFVRMAFSPNY